MEYLSDPRWLLNVVLPLALIAAGLVAGLFLEKVILRWLNALAERTRWRADNVIFKAIRGVPVFWGLAAGIYLATLSFEVAPLLTDVLRLVLVVAVLWSFTIIGARIAAGMVSTYASREASFLPTTSLIPGLIRLSVYVVGLLIILSTLDISITPLLTALGVGGLAVALALQNTLANAFAGLYLIASGQINPGDYVRIDSGEEGYTIDIDWRSTTVRTVLGNTVIIPNAKMASSVVTNYTLGHHDIQVRVPVAVDYESDLRRVEAVTLEVARAVMRDVVPEVRQTAPQLYVHTFGEFSLNLTVILAVRDFYDQYRLRHEFMIRLMERYREEGIRIPFPIKEFEMELSTEGLDAGRPGRLYAPDQDDPPAEEPPPRPDAIP